MGSLRSKLVLGTAAATVAIFLLAAVAIYLAARASLLSEFDTASVVKANAIASAVELKDQRVVIELEPGRFPAFEGGEHPEYFTVWSDQFRELIRSASLREGQLLQPTQHETEGVTLPDGRAGRQVSIPFKPHVDEDTTPSAGVPTLRLAVARETADLDRTLANLRWVLIIVCGAGTALLLALTAWIISRSLRPVDRLARDIGGIGESNLAQRLAPAKVPDELAPVVQRLNELLGRLQSAFERERAFTADAAHELRTPLAGLEAALEVCASRPREPEAYQQTVQDCLNVVRRMHAMIENLLMLARADARQIRQEPAEVDVPRLLRETWSPFEAAANTRRVRLEWDLNGSTTIHSDRQKLAQILSNLFDNATRYVDNGGVVRVSESNSDDRLRITISNSGSRVASEDAPRVFDRFWRADSSRSSPAGNSGLGLSVCRKLAESLGAQIDATSNLGGDFAVHLSLPIDAGTAERDVTPR